jgi:transposase
MAEKTTRVRRTFTPQFKRDAVDLVVKEGKTVTEVARSLGISRSLLQRWREQLETRDEQAFPGRGRPGAELGELRRLKKQLKDVTEERDILKKALAYFADDQK